VRKISWRNRSATVQFAVGKAAARRESGLQLRQRQQAPLRDAVPRSRRLQKHFHDQGKRDFSVALAASSNFVSRNGLVSRKPLDDVAGPIEVFEQKESLKTLVNRQIERKRCSLFGV